MSDSRSIALGIIRAEHRALAAVINNMKVMLGEIRANRMKVDFPLFWSMIYYIDTFPDQLHHPKENDWIFASVKLRTQEGDSLVDELLEQHKHEDVALAKLRRLLGNYEAGVPGGLAEFDEEVQRYADFNWKHMRAEEHELLPLAEKVLTDADWDGIAKVFEENLDPLIGHHEDEHFSSLFRQILEKTPAPLGLGNSDRS